MATHAHTAMVKAVMDLLNLRKILAWKNHCGSTRMPSGRWVTFGHAGLPDVLAVLPPSGRLAGFEIKTGSGCLSAPQRAVRGRFEASGAMLVVVRDLGELNALLDTLLTQEDDHG